MRDLARPSRAGAAAVAVLTVFAAACDLGVPAGRSPHQEGNRLDMIDQPKLKPQRADLTGRRPTGTLEPPAGAVAADETPYPYTQAQAAQAGADLVNPLPASPEVLAHGQFVYENVCITCHGPKGAGDGHLTQLFPKPPSLMTQKVRDWPDGEIFHRPMRGQGSMPSHARQIDARDAWSVVRYIRQMQSREPVAPPAAAPAPAATPSAGASASQGQSPASAPAPAAPAPGATVSGGRS
jgi:mono/diheme cytochrome c family protein